MTIHTRNRAAEGAALHPRPALVFLPGLVDGDGIPRVALRVAGGPHGRPIFRAYTTLEGAIAAKRAAEASTP